VPSEDLPNKILIVDNDKIGTRAVSLALEKMNIKVDTAHDRESALYLFNQNKYPVVLVDKSFDQIPGLVMLQKWRKHEVIEKRTTGFILTIGNRIKSEKEEENLIKELDGIEVVIKPYTATSILPILKRAASRQLKDEEFAQISENALKIAKTPQQVPKAVAMVEKQLPEFGSKATGVIREIYENNEMWEDSLKLVDQELKKQPKLISLLGAKGMLLMRMGRHEDALAFMEVADKHAPLNLDRMNKMAMAYLETKQVDKSVDKMRKLIAFHDDNPEVKFDMFSQLYDHGFDEHALALCKDTTSPKEVVRYYNNKGVALAKAGRVEEAINEYVRCLKFYPTYKENYRICYNIALSQVSKKTRSSYESALEYVDKCLALNKSFEKAINMKVAIEKALGGKSSEKENSKKDSKAS
jgi:tetratricopeptide (TPR) repeat protein